MVEFIETREAAKAQNYLQGKAMLETALKHAALSDAEKRTVQQQVHPTESGFNKLFSILCQPFTIARYPLSKITGKGYQPQINLKGEKPMKKALLVVAVLALSLVIFGAGFVFAQFQPVSAQALPPYYMIGWGGGMHGHGGYGPIHDYVEQALAEKLGQTETKIEEQLAAGKTMYQIALDAGIPEADIPALMEAVHKSAFDKAVADGVLTQAQADAMLQRMTAQGWGNCPNGGIRPMDGTGFQRGHGMRGGGRWNNQQPSQTNP